ncbi:MAG: CAP domain-containing protein [Candidatus Kapabacteria bacterium]|nr:CAP domain-containing protein [Candidatus Kapabacteria bacterium]
MKILFKSMVALIAIITFSCSNTNNPQNCQKILDPQLAIFYDCQPNPSNCTEGSVTAAEKTKVLNRLNQIRTIHGLPKVTYNFAEDNLVQKAALLTLANKVMTHQPSSVAHCFSDDAYNGCDQSNLWLGTASAIYQFSSEQMVDSWLIDKDVLSLGHRRWMLNPYLSKISFGRADGFDASTKLTCAGVIKIFDRKNQEIKTSFSGNYVAYPVNEYPKSLFNSKWYYSFSVVIDPNNLWASQSVDYSSASVTMVDEGGTALSVSGIKYDNEGYGVPNSLQWLGGSSIQESVKYNVTIKNVIVNGISKNYSYWFKINPTN